MEEKPPQNPAQHAQLERDKFLQQVAKSHVVASQLVAQRLQRMVAMLMNARKFADSDAPYKGPTVRTILNQVIEDLDVWHEALSTTNPLASLADNLRTPSNPEGPNG